MFPYFYRCIFYSVYDSYFDIIRESNERFIAKMEDW